MALLIAVSIYCYLIKYQRKHLLLFHSTNNKLNNYCINSINKKSYKNIIIYYIRYETIKKDLEIMWIYRLDL